MTNKKVPDLTDKLAGKLAFISSSTQNIYRTLMIINRDLAAIEKITPLVEEMCLDGDLITFFQEMSEEDMIAEFLPRLHKCLGAAVPLQNAIEELHAWNKTQMDKLTKEYGEDNILRTEEQRLEREMAAAPPVQPPRTKKGDPDPNLH